MTDRVYNFAPGPAVLPLPVLEEAQRDLLSLPGLGISVLEISHRSKWCGEILAEAEENLRRLLAVPKDYRIVFLQGGARLQFSMVPLNFLRHTTKRADYVLTGTWGEKALHEARREGGVRIAWSGKDDGYARAPRTEELDLDSQAAYVHFTSNETIQGVQFPTAPDVGQIPLVCDASSDFLSRPLAVEDHGLIYACAQKNAGAAGLTIVILQPDLLDRVPDGLPSMLDYRRQAESGSVLNTPPVFGIYLFVLITRWILGQAGGLEKLAQLNREKADLLYRELDESDAFYRGHAQPQSRSLMNVTFRLDEGLEKDFLTQAHERGLCELKGHRSVGGIRASIYNAMPRQGVEALRDFMREFRQQHER